MQRRKKTARTDYAINQTKIKYRKEMYEDSNIISKDELPIEIKTEDLLDTRYILNYLDNYDKDIYILHYYHHARQATISDCIGKSQSFVSHRIKKLGGKVEYIIRLHNSYIPSYLLFLKENKYSEVYKPVELMCLTGFLYSSTYATAARVCNICVPSFMHFFSTAKEKMKKNDIYMYTIFEEVEKNLRILNRNCKKSERVEKIKISKSLSGVQKVE